MKFPSEKELKKVRKKLEKAEGFAMLDPDANELDRFRFKICQELLKYSHKKDMNTVEMAKLLGLSLIHISEPTRPY